MRKALVVLGNCRRKGNTERLSQEFARGLKDAGHEVVLADLRKLDVRPCTGCNACRFGKPCVQRDDFNALVPDITSADVVALASPLHFWMLSSSIMAFIERLYRIAQEDNKPPKGRYEYYPVHGSALLMTAADDNFWTFAKAEEYWRYALINYIGFEDRGVLLAGGCGDSSGRPAIERTDHLRRAYEFGLHVLDDRPGQVASVAQ